MIFHKLQWTRFLFIYTKSHVFVGLQLNLRKFAIRTCKENTVSVFIGIFFSPSRWLFHPFSYKDMLTWLGQFLYLSCITRELEISIHSILKLKWAETEDNRFLLSKTVSFHNKERKHTIGDHHELMKKNRFEKKTLLYSIKKNMNV